MSKEIKKLKAFFRDLNEDEQSHKRTMRKLKAFQKWLELNVPDNITGTYSFSGDLGETCVRLFIYLNKDEASTIAVLKWLPVLKKQRFTIEKFWRENDGYFSYRVWRTYKPYTDYLILIEESANIDGCVIVEKEVTKKIFTTDCEKESVML